MTLELERYIERVHARTKAEAERAARLEAALREAWSSPGGRAFAQFVETRPAAATRRAYRHHLADFLAWLAARAGVVDPLDATPEDLAGYERDVDSRVSPKTKRRLALRSRQERIRTVRTAYQFCADEELVERSPARHLKIRGRAEPRRTYLDDEQAVRLLAACAGARPSDVRDRTLIAVLLHTGLRAAEVSSLTWGAVRDDAAAITVEGKGRVVRTIPLSVTAVAAFEEWARFASARRHAGDPVWSRLNHRLDGGGSRATGRGAWSFTLDPLTPDAVHAIVTRRAARAGLEGVTPHTLRRTYATKLRSIGVAIDTISRFLGHASILTTVGYFDPHDDVATRAVKSLDYSQSK